MNTGQVIIRRATAQDLPEIYALEQECFVSPWNAELLLLDICASELNLYYVMEQEERIIGFAGINVVLDEGHIRKICIAPDMRRNGYGSIFLQELEKQAYSRGAEGLTLEVRSSNKAAIAMYERFGFRQEGLRRKYYDNKEDALIMWKHDIVGVQE